MRYIYVITTNTLKYLEFVSHFKLYGIEVRQKQPDSDNSTSSSDFQTWFESEKDLLAVLIEQTQLLEYRDRDRPDTDDGSDTSPSDVLVKGLPHLARVTHRSDLECHFRAKKPTDLILNASYTQFTEGYLDLTRAATSTTQASQNVFGWDDVFVLPLLGLTLHELRLLGHKVSPRDKNTVSFIKQRLYYGSLVDLKHRPIRPKRPVTFDLDPWADFVSKVDPYQGEAAKQFGILNMITTVLNDGVFLRSSINRREKTYWWPGLNAGIPLVPKPKDASQEVTFMTHDFGHFLIPDLIFDGTDTPLHRFVYCAYRLMSEATTIVLADMVFVHAAQQDGLVYETRDRRQIYPLFRATGFLNGHSRATDVDAFKSAISELLHASMEFCLTGQTAAFEQLLAKNKEADPTEAKEALDAFVSKYSAFFIEDFRWTVANYDYMKERSGDYEKWWTDISPVVTPDLGLMTVSDYISALEGQEPGVNLEQLRTTDPRGLIDRIHAYVIHKRVLPALGGDGGDVTLAPWKQRRCAAFRRYMIGQSLVFTQFAHVPQANRYKNLILSALQGLGPEDDLAVVNNIRNCYAQFLDLCVRQEALDQDDCTTFNEVYPLVSPHFVNYDAFTDVPDISELARAEGFLLDS